MRVVLTRRAGVELKGSPPSGLRERADGRGWGVGGGGVVSASDNVHMCCIASLPVRARHEERWIERECVSESELGDHLCV